MKQRILSTGGVGLKNIRKSAIVFIILLMVSFLTPSTAFATSDDDLDVFWIFRK